MARQSKTNVYGRNEKREVGPYRTAPNQSIEPESNPLAVVVERFISVGEIINTSNKYGCSMDFVIVCIIMERASVCVCVCVSV